MDGKICNKEISLKFNKRPAVHWKHVFSQK